MKRSILAGLAALAVAGLWACDEDLATGVDDELLPLSVRTVELNLPWSEFGVSIRSFGGFGLTTQLGRGFLAEDFEETGLDARTLARFDRLPVLTEIPTGEGDTEVTPFSVKGARITAFFDTARSVVEDPVTVVARAVRTRWDPGSATWEQAVDSINDTLEWPEAGGGPADSVGFATWDPGTTDSVVIEVDSATAVQWTDPEDETRGIRLDVREPGALTVVDRLRYRALAVPFIRQDTVVEVPALTQDLTFIYDPVPAVPENGLRVGGAPSWRTVVELDVPESVDGPPELCEAVGCPFSLDPEQLNGAFLIFRTRTSEAAFRPTDTLLVDIRPVLFPDLLPKAPLGGTLLRAPVALDPGSFDDDAGQNLVVSITGFAEDILRGDRPDGTVPPRSLAILSLAEPSSLGFGSFIAPGEEGGPRLRLILTVADTVRIR